MSGPSTPSRPPRPSTPPGPAASPAATGLSRRAFLVGSGATLGAGALLGSAGLAAAGRLVPTASAEAASAVGGPWVAPEVRASSGGGLATELVVAEGPVKIAADEVRALAYERTYPGPTLEIRPGDQLGIELVNQTGQPTNLHTHGLHVSPRRPADDVLLDIAPGDRFPYRYAIPADHPGGTFWYHAHRHLLSDNQVFGGLFGMLIVRGALDELPGVAGLAERPIIISQMQVVDDAVAEADRSSLSDQVTLVNGQYHPTLEMAPGESQRWRILNTSSVFLRLGLGGHPFHVIAVDGNALPAPAASEVLVVPPGGRVDAIVQAPLQGSLELRSLSWQDAGVFYTSMVPVPQLLLHGALVGQAVAPTPLPTRLLPFDDLRGATIDRRRVFRLEEREPRGTGKLDQFRYFINGRLFDHSKVNETIQLGATEEWEFVNLTYEPHPLHIHVNPFQVVAINGEPANEQHYRDTALIPPFGSLTLRHRFEDFTGVFPFHCHILFHEDHGMMQLVEVVGTEAPGTPSTASPPTSHH